MERREPIVQQLVPGAFCLPSPCWEHKTMKTIKSSVNNSSTPSFSHTFLTLYYVSVEKINNYAQEDRLGKGRSQDGCLLAWVTKKMKVPVSERGVTFKRC